jgi:hypothetical protein
MLRGLINEYKRADNELHVSADSRALTTHVKRDDASAVSGGRLIRCPHRSDY